MNRLQMERLERRMCTFQNVETMMVCADKEEKELELFLGWMDGGVQKMWSWRRERGFI